MELELEEGGAGGAELRRGTQKKLFFPVGITNRDKRDSFVPVARSGTKGFPLLSRHGVPVWETGTKNVSQPGQIKVSVVVICNFCQTKKRSFTMIEKNSSRPYNKILRR
jgi:hypothetical protein